MLIVPLVPVASQSVNVVLAGQPCTINVYAKSTGMFLDLLVNDVLIIAGVVCLDGVRIVRDLYLGFTGDLAIFDTQGALGQAARAGRRRSHQAVITPNANSQSPGASCETRPASALRTCSTIWSCTPSGSKLS
jgi:hypothetical protein